MARRVQSRVSYDSSFASHWGGDHARDRKSFAGILELESVALNSGGYTPQGRYFGRGATLYRVVGGDSTQHVEFYIRAANRSTARHLVQSGYPNAHVAR